ncbi:NERD domain-containing protein [Collimonas silvisoli]|uniref:NERD domain-containing protein n=1 Tax=Collimonas silvisoli TaxID=2825884 RepID=UPI001B8BD2EE|nr:NERD domain-containing protein [Collimonas silvisoli]
MNASPDFPPLIRIFIGEPIQNQSEHDCLRAVCEALAQIHSWAYIFANFHASGRQIDLAVFTEKTTLVIEAKGYSLPVRGGVNGQWEQFGPFGARKIGNAYIQALNAKNALRDEMQRMNQIDGYPNGLVVVAPIVPEGSTLTSGDFKVAVTDLDQLAQLLTRPSGALLTQDLGEVLARQLGLEAIVSADAALNDEILVAERSCETYLKAFGDFYEPLAAELVSDQYKCGVLEVGPPQVQSMVASGHAGVLIHGPSGCGKTLLATSCAISCVATGCIPIFVSAKNFDGELQRLLDREAALLNTRSASNLITAGRLLGKRVILFLDGYNECRDDLKLSLTRSLKAFALRYGAGLVVSTQQDLVRADLLMTKTVIVKRPSDELKVALARLEERADGAGNFRSLIQVASSGLEAGLVGQVGAFLPAGASRFALFDTYARTKLRTAAAEGIRVLSSFAETLVHRACFSLSVREFDRLCDSTNLDHEARQHLLRSQLLQVRGDRVSFIHELFFSAFSAEAAIRSANGDLTRIRAALGSPRFFSSKAFILGAIEDDRAVYEVLESLTDHDLLSACSRGECGAAAQSIVKRKTENMLEVMIAEAQSVRFQIIGEGWNSIAIDKRTFRHELTEFDSYLAAIGQGLMDGQYLDAVMAACRHMDQTITIFSNACAADAKAKKIPLRHEVFSAAYVMYREAAISRLINFIHSGGLSFHRQEGLGFGPALRAAWLRAETPGQFYFLIGLTKFSAHDKEAAQYVARLLRNVRSYPYHLQLDLIDFAQHLGDAEEPYREEIIDALQACLDKLGVMMNSIIFEALKRLGALEDDAYSYVPVIRDEIDNTLSTDSGESDLSAWRLFSCQFDHPFDSSYWDEIQGLDDSRRKLLLTKACRGAETPYLSFLGILIRQLSEFNDPNVASAIARWTALPEKQSCMPQDAVEIFINAHEALGHLGVELPQSRGEPTTAAEHALLACGELYYWASRIDLEAPQTSTYTDAARSILLDHSLCASAGTLQLTTSRMLSTDGARISLVKYYPDIYVAICREALKRRNQQVSYFEHGFLNNVDSIACFVIQVLGELGEINDLQSLRDFCDHEHYGISSLDAIKKIEERTRISLFDRLNVY